MIINSESDYRIDVGTIRIGSIYHEHQRVKLNLLGAPSPIKICSHTVDEAVTNIVVSNGLNDDAVAWLRTADAISNKG